MNSQRWPMVPIGSCCTIISGSTPRRDNPIYWDGTIPWITPKDISSLNQKILHKSRECITELGLKSCSTQLLPEGTVLFSSRAPIGLVAVAGIPVCTNQGFKSLIPSSDIDSSYLYHCMRYYASEIALLGNGATFKEVSKEIVSRFHIPLPPLVEQKRIAANLDKSDAIRRKRQEAIALTDQFLKSVFLDMFGDPVTNPKGWKTSALSTIADIASGVTKGRRYINQDLICVPYMRVANVQDGHITLNEVKEIEVTEVEAARYMLLPNDILMTEGGDPDKLGRGAIWHGEIQNCIHQNHIFRVRITSDTILPEYLNTLIGSPYGKRYFLQAAKQTTGIASINKTQLSAFPVLIPSRRIQEKYTNIVHGYKKAESKLSTADATYLSAALAGQFFS